MKHWLSYKTFRHLQLVHLLLVSILSLILSSCSGIDLTKIPPEKENKIITIQTNGNINSKLALAIDLVLSYDQEVYSQIKGMDAPTFRLKKSQLLLDHPNGLSIWTLDFVEHQHKSVKLPKLRNYWGLVIFLHFINNPQNRIVIPMKMHAIELNIADNSFKISNGSYVNHNVVRLYEGDEYNVVFD